MNLDTSFLIDLHREYRGRSHSGARDFLLHHSLVRFKISVMVYVEFLEGLRHSNESKFLEHFRLVPFEEPQARVAAEIRKTLRKQGTLIGDLDVCIAASALVSGEPLVTANEEHFGRVKGLEVISYRTA